MTLSNSSAHHLPASSALISSLDLPTLSFFLATAVFVVLFSRVRRSRDTIPILNPKKKFELTAHRVKKLFLTNGNAMVDSWFNANPHKPARLHADFGEVTILPPNLTNEIRNDERFNFSKWTLNAFHGHTPGFEGFREGGHDSRILQNVIIKDITKSLNQITEPLAEETALAVSDVLPSDKEWHTIPIRSTIAHIVARVSSRVFLGTEICRNKRWLEITLRYTVDAFMAAGNLRLWPAPLRPLVHWFMPSCQKLRSEVAEAKEIITPVLEDRRLKKKQAQQGQVKYEAPDDAIEWVERAANGESYDPVSIQLILSVAAIHTTSDLVTQVMIRLAQNPEILEPLRNEIQTTLKQDGWRKTSLYNMKLLDSVIKESQRIKPIGNVVMRRVASEDVTLSDGTRVSKDSTIAVTSRRLWDKTIYAEPDKWDGYRFYNMRSDPDKQASAQLVATSDKFLAWGHGKHACPGRFFASNEVKIILIHLLMNYDWELPEGASTAIHNVGLAMTMDPALELRIKEREVPIEI
ncbi:unnamed protein product [Clonostachys rosea f. rosea IK726]|uniref:Cytochrome P450 monooxygenase n=2 Tax=Bionectria ochroleuca TaxID=29856 RepID=A0A0B7K9Z6_BIOOC|nr:unnamed protein product [Clonostachys rosea f. rosea IK726]